jgi:cob(I)alamin adenosyltransferase
MIHIYSGDGKGKTTAVVGLAVRAAGGGRKVVFAQFIKSAPSGELKPLVELGVKVIRSEMKLGFTFQMDSVKKELCRGEQRRILNEAVCTVQMDSTGLLVLDEVLDAVSAGVLDEDLLRYAIRALPVNCELALTGRPVPDWLADAADYYSLIKKIKHPFDKGIAAREGIEK